MKKTEITWGNVIVDLIEIFFPLTIWSKTFNLEKFETSPKGFRRQF